MPSFTTGMIVDKYPEVKPQLIPLAASCCEFQRFSRTGIFKLEA